MSAFGETAEVKSVQLIAPVDEGVPGPEHFRIVSNNQSWKDLSDSVPEGGVLLRVYAISADPYLRMHIKNPKGTAGMIMTGFVAGKIVTSRNARWKEGDYFGGNLPFTTVQVLPEAQANTSIWPIVGKVTDETISYGIGVLGMPGATAYGGLIDVLAAKEGETIFISGAAGAVGGMVGMLAKSLFNNTVIGSCGGPEKVAFVKEHYGFDHAIDYKTIRTKEEMIAALQAVAPDGIDTYFDNVGGIHLEAAMEVLRPRGRIAICGQISDYNSKEFVPLAFNPWRMIYTQQRIEGFMSADWLSGKRGNFHTDMARFVEEGKVAHIEETVFHGIENWPLAFQALFTGANKGKVVVRVL